MKVNQINTSYIIVFSTKLKAFFSLMKVRLSSLVVMSAFFGFLLADGDLLSYDFFLLIVGGVLVTGSANGFNQVIETKTDELMSRTQNRPMPSKVLTKGEAIVFCLLIGIIGSYFLWLINLKSLMLGLLAIVTYALIYTPLKKVTPFSVFKIRE